MAFLFDDLITASARTIKEFINFIFVNCKSVVYYFKKWLWELKGEFRQYDAFADIVYGHFDDLEDYEVELQQSYKTAVEEEKEAVGVLRELISRDAEFCEERLEARIEAVVTCRPAGDLVPLVMVPGVGWQPAPPNGLEAEEEAYLDRQTDTAALEVTAKQLSADVRRIGLEDAKEDAWANLAKKTIARQDTKKHVLDVYFKKKGHNYFGRWVNTFRSRMKYIARVVDKRKRLAAIAEPVTEQVHKYDDLPSFYSMCEAKMVPTGRCTEEKDDQGIKTSVPETILERSIKPEFRTDAASWIRAFVRSKNQHCTTDAISLATITRYVESFCEREKLDMASKAYLIKRALIAVPVPDKDDMGLAMLLHCPISKAIRSKYDCLMSSVF